METNNNNNHSGYPTLTILKPVIKLCERSGYTMEVRDDNGRFVLSMVNTRNGDKSVYVTLHTATNIIEAYRTAVKFLSSMEKLFQAETDSTLADCVKYQINELMSRVVREAIRRGMSYDYLYKVFYECFEKETEQAELDMWFQLPYKEASPRRLVRKSK
jgi:hypothetical protein